MFGVAVLAFPIHISAQRGGIDPRGNPPEEFRGVLPFPGDNPRVIENLPTRFRSIADVVATIFNIVIGISGAIFMVLLLVGGVQYMTAAGNEENTTKAKKLLVDAVIGLVLTLSAWAIGTFILRQFYGPSTGVFLPSGGGGTRPGSTGGGPIGGAANTAQNRSTYNSGFTAGRTALQENDGDVPTACSHLGQTNDPYFRPPADSTLQAYYTQGFSHGCNNLPSSFPG